MRRHRTSERMILTLSGALIFGCSGQETPSDGAGPETKVRAPTSVPSLVEIEGASTSTGFAIGTLRRSEQVESFRITRHPITVSEYQACVQAGACVEVAGALACTAQQRHSLGEVDIASDDVPIVCAAPIEANRYCAWIGGRLPTLSEWLLAARGTSVRRHPWGNTAPTCEQHPGGSGTAGESGACAQAEDRRRALEVGRHPDGSSPSGVEDVLLTPGELIAGSATAMVPACGTTGEACVAYGLTPGAIDAVAALPRTRGKGPTRGLGPDPAYGFRCSLEGL